jgi:hypothetical protein
MYGQTKMNNKASWVNCAEQSGRVICTVIRIDNLNGCLWKFAHSRILETPRGMAPASNLPVIGGVVTLDAPFASPRFTVRVAAGGNAAPQLTAGEKPVPLREVTRPTDLKPGTWRREKPGVVVCFDLPRGRSRLKV